MKKILSFVLAAVAIVFAACSNDENIETSGNGQNNKGMVLVATVSQQDSRAAIDANETFGTWNFAFTDNDNVVVGNNTINDYYKFTKSGETFSSTEAKVTSSAADWYAYYPGTDIDLTNQEGTSASAAKLYALAGKTAEATTGSTPPLKISMDAKVAVLRIVKVDNYGPCDIYLKTADGKYVSGLKAKKNEAGYDVVKSDTKVSVFTKANEGNAGIYYVIVPAGVKISVYNTNDENRIKTTKAAGLTAGRYYTLTTGPTTGTETATLANGTTETVNWVQLWIGGPRFATKNVADPLTWHDAAKTGKDFAWGEKWHTPSKADIKPFVDLAADVEAWTGKSEIKKAGYPTFEPKTDAQDGFNYVLITGYQPGYNKNTLYLYNKISSGYNTYTFWTSDHPTEGSYYGCEFQIVEYEGLIGSFGISHITDKNTKVLTRPILTTKTVLWKNQYVKE